MQALTSRPLPLARSTKRAISASIFSMLFVALVCATPNSPFFPILPLDYEPTGPFRWIADLLGFGRLSMVGLIFLGLLATVSAAIGFILILREAWNGRLSMRAVVLLAVAYHVAVVTLPLLFSRDVYSYAYYGRTISTYNANPYVFVPRDFPRNSLFQLTWPGWRGTPSVYGPLFTWLSALMTGTYLKIKDLITGFQVLAAAASIGATLILARTAQKLHPRRAVFAAAIVGMNPIVVFHVVGGGHNDMLVAFFIAAALALLLARRELLSAVCLGLGMSVKVTAVVPLLLLVVAVVAAAPIERRRRVLITYGGAVAGVWLLFALPYLQMSNPTLGLTEVAGHDSWMAPGQLVVQLARGIGWVFARDAGADIGDTAARIGLFGLSAVGIVMIARQVWRRVEARTPERLAAAWGWGLLILILPSPVLFTWYLVWILPLAWVLPRIARRGLVILSACFIVTQLVTESSRLPEIFQQVKLPFGHPVAIAVLIWVGRDFIRRMRTDTLLDAETPGKVFGDRLEKRPARPREEIVFVDEPERVASGGGLRAPVVDRVAMVTQVSLQRLRI
jgi:alpha-1,6-mannosyltransferase